MMSCSAWVAGTGGILGLGLLALLLLPQGRDRLFGELPDTPEPLDVDQKAITGAIATWGEHLHELSKVSQLLAMLVVLLTLSNVVLVAHQTLC